MDEQSAAQSDQAGLPRSDVKESRAAPPLQDVEGCCSRGMVCHVQSLRASHMIRADESALGMTLANFVEAFYVPERIRPMSAGARQQVEIAVRVLSKACGRTLTLRDLEPKRFESILAEYAIGKSPATVKSKRNALASIWRCAYRHELVDSEPRKLPDVPIDRPLPTSWSKEEMRKIFDACKRARTVKGKRGTPWGPTKWRAMLLTIYDTSHRVRALTLSRVEQIDFSTHRLRLEPEQLKQRVGTDHKLAAQTIEAISATLDRPRTLLFDWPLAYREIFREYRRILKSAGVAHTRRDMFHKWRRTSYTAVWDRLGPQAATRHAGHSTDLSRIYLDPGRLSSPDAADVIDRPV